ncbi:MAG: DNA mismatch repair endonuclease MutL [Tatlockia sp.]|nr:DNA mismatch repair endonuclease MutL [Tatlockia sp.]
MRILQLSAVLANQIAAGEVIERPASVVKELLENSFDAGADHISIDIGYGGLTQIKISDNGAGIVADDLPLAIAAHATSKISQLNDLYAIATMGFRGEALASIASISRLTISSKTPDQSHAMMLSADGEGKVTLSPCARSKGTTVDVRDIFFNAPVRKKFLKPERSEFQAIELVVKRFALSAPHIAINLSHNSKQLLNIASANCDKTNLIRIRKILGKSFVEQANYLDSEHAGLHLRGWLSSKNLQRSQNDRLWIYLNNRMVKDKLLNHAIKQAYEGLLYPGRYPSCLLYLTLKPSEVDVNVHPTKHEVRFQQPRLIHDFICSQLQKTLREPEDLTGYQIESKSIESGSLTLSEPYSPPYLIKSTSLEKLRKETNWTNLNNSFALIFLEQEPFLIDVLALQRNWLLSVLKSEKLPLASRPLLVPLSLIINCKPDQFKIYRDALYQLGIELGLASENSVLVRSLPLAVPHLDLKNFLTLFFSESLPSTTKLLELLVSNQSLTSQCLSSEEQQILIAYMQTLSTDIVLNFSKQLSLQTCLGVLNA